jgi:hypothetical protein
LAAIAQKSSFVNGVSLVVLRLFGRLTGFLLTRFRVAISDPFR